MSELERSLRGLGRELVVPEAPDLVEAVRARIEPRRPRRTVERRRWVLAVAVAALALLGATLAIPDARSALFRILNIGGERIELVEELPDVEPLDDLELTLGEPVTLEQARARSNFELRELEDAPDRVYLGERGTVWFLYGSPANVRLLVSQTPRSTVDEPALLKKIAREAEVEEVTVNGARGVFVSGPHFLFLVDEDGFAVEASARLAEDVLIWDEGGVAYRLEGDFELDEALEIARKLQPRLGSG
jgi:hypothetical protein